MQRADVDVGALTAVPAKEEAVKAETEEIAAATTARQIFMVLTKKEERTRRRCKEW
jgi:predicted exporter